MVLLNSDQFAAITLINALHNNRMANASEARNKNLGQTGIPNVADAGDLVLDIVPSVDNFFLLSYSSKQCCAHKNGKALWLELAHTGFNP